jgi:alpha-methylacyl-CoA racemase
MTVEVETHRGPLAGIRIIDLSRLAPGPYCTMLLADLGADVIVVGGGRAGAAIPELARGKRFLALDLKAAAGQAALHALVRTADVLVEGFRPGVADRLGAGYAELSKLNPRLVICAITGYGQDGPRAREAGHDINYLALTGVLGAIGPADRRPYPPLNLLADFAGGSMVAALGILAAVLEARRSGRGQFVDAAMIDGALSLMAMHLPLWRTRMWPHHGSGLLVGDAPFYRTYRCADDRYVAVGALEPQFFRALWTMLGLSDAPDHMDRATWPRIEEALTDAFGARSRDDWGAIFAGSDACVTPVLNPDEVWSEPQVAARHPGGGRDRVPVVPRFSRTPGVVGPVDLTDHGGDILRELGFDAQTARAARPAEGDGGGMSWPPPLR